MKFCFATTDTALSIDFIDTDFSKVNPWFLQHRAGVGPQKVWMYNSLSPWDCGHLLQDSCKFQRRWGDHNGHVGVFSLWGNPGVLRQESNPSPPALLWVPVLLFLWIPKSGSQCHRLVCRECAQTRVYGRGGAPTQSKAELLTIFAKEFQDHTR